MDHPAENNAMLLHPVWAKLDNGALVAICTCRVTDTIPPKQNHTARRHASMNKMSALLPHLAQPLPMEALLQSVWVAYRLRNTAGSCDGIPV
jgi:hypothetical protein